MLKIDIIILELIIWLIIEVKKIHIFKAFIWFDQNQLKVYIKFEIFCKMNYKYS